MHGRAKQSTRSLLTTTRIDLAGCSGEVSLNRPLLRYAGNPILTCHDVNRVWTDPRLQVVTVHNAGVARRDDETCMLFRSHLRCGVSVIGLARSTNGVDGWWIHPHPVLLPATALDDFDNGTDREEIIDNESGGVEDPRISWMGSSYAITYSAYHAREKNRVRVHLATSEDLVHFVRHGPISSRDMRNVVLFDRPFQGRYAALLRPNDVSVGDVGGTYAEIRLGWSQDWRRGPWEIADQPLMRTGHGPSAFQDKIGPGAPPIETPEGWLSIFHGVRTTMDGNPYVLGVALHDREDPSRVLMSSIPILFPSAADCRVADDDYVHVPNVVFTCGALRENDGTLRIYYGGNDTVMNVALTHERVLLALCREYGQDPIAGGLFGRI